MMVQAVMVKTFSVTEGRSKFLVHIIGGT